MSEQAETQRVISGFRPTSDLTVGNYLGGIRPSLEIQENPENDLYVFVADMHGLTDHDPREIGPYVKGVVKDCLALGVDPDKTTIYLQSDIEAPVTQVANRLSPYVSVSELARTPNLKEKMQTAIRKGEQTTENSLNANFALLGYPVLMAADIFAQETPKVAVGQDQEPHLELARTLGSRFNKKFNQEVLVMPTILAVESLRIVSLNGNGKMSKTNPNQAILLSDTPDETRAKIKRATTAHAGEWNEVIDSHFIVAEGTAASEDIRAELGEIKAAHIAGKAVMGGFKKLWGDITEDFILNFQSTREEMTDAYVDEVLKRGAEKAGTNADSVLEKMRAAMGM